MSYKVVILAAGKGTRMKSKLPKVLHPVVGKTMVQRVVEAARGLNPDQIYVVTSEDAEPVKRALEGQEDVTFVTQAEQLGSGHAVLCSKDAVLADGGGKLVILNGDLPRLTSESLARFREAWDHSGCKAAVLSCRVPDPTGYGRIVREKTGKLLRIVEHRDATPEVLALDEINVGIYGADAARLYECLSEVGTDNDQGEIYLTDGFHGLMKHGLEVEVVEAETFDEFEGVNHRGQLAAAIRHVFARNAHQHMVSGVTLVDPATTYIEDGVEIGQDTWIEPGVTLRAGTKIGEDCEVGAHCVLTRAQLADGVTIHPHSVLEDCEVASGANVGPFARLRVGSKIGPKARVGNFVETKKATLEEGAKASHLSYLGDCKIGEGSNIGAGTITCNYDGFGKHFTEIGSQVFVGSNQTLVAPLIVEDGAFLAAGSTISRKVPKDALALGRARQENKENYAQRLRERLARAKQDQ